jgi:hypothetical protein
MIPSNALLEQISESTRVNVSAIEFKVFEDTLVEFSGFLRLYSHINGSFWRRGRQYHHLLLRWYMPQNLLFFRGQMSRPISGSQLLRMLGTCSSAWTTARWTSLSLYNTFFLFALTQRGEIFGIVLFSWFGSTCTVVEVDGGVACPFVRNSHGYDGRVAWTHWTLQACHRTPQLSSCSHSLSYFQISVLRG